MAVVQICQLYHQPKAGCWNVARENGRRTPWHVDTNYPSEKIIDNFAFSFVFCFFQMIHWHFLFCGCIQRRYIQILHGDELLECINLSEVQGVWKAIRYIIKISRHNMNHFVKSNTFILLRRGPNMLVLISNKKVRLVQCQKFPRLSVCFCLFLIFLWGFGLFTHKLSNIVEC